MLLTGIYLFSILFSVLIAFMARRSLNRISLGPFLPYLLLVFCQEMIAQLYMGPRKMSTGLIYNIYVPVSTAFFAITYLCIPVNKKVRKVILLLLGIYLISVLAVHIYFNLPEIFALYLLMASGFVITCCAIFFLLNYFSVDNADEQKKWLPVVWISIGIVVFYPVVNIGFALYKQITAYNITLWGHKLYQTMPQVMSIFMYSCFAYAFYLCRRINQNS